MANKNFNEVYSEIYQFKGISNFYLVLGEENFLVDTGMPGKTKELEKGLEQIGKDPRDITKIIITHHHFDHIGSLDKIKKLTGATVEVHGDDWPYITGEKINEGPALMGFLVKLMNILYRIKPVEKEIVLNDGDKIGEYTVIHTPGHTPGSICLYNPKNKVLFVGDNLRYNKGILESPTGRLLPDILNYKKSMEKLGNLDVKIILTGHGQPVINDANRLLKEFLKSIT